MKGVVLLLLVFGSELAHADLGNPATAAYGPDCYCYHQNPEKRCRITCREGQRALCQVNPWTDDECQCRCLYPNKLSQSEDNLDQFYLD